MKKFVIIFLICALVFLLPLTACTIENGGSGQVSGSPPYEIRFDTPEDFEAMLFPEQMTDSELATYLEVNANSLSNITTRSEANALAQQLTAIPYIRVVDDSVIARYYMAYRPDTEYYYFIIRTVDNVRYHFSYTIFEEHIDRSNMVEAGTFELDGETVVLYPGDDCLVGELYLDGYQLRIVVDFYSDIEQISFEPFALCRPDGSNPIA
jgi:hypothetical protein